MDEMEVEIKVWLSDSPDPSELEKAAAEMSEMLDLGRWSHDSTTLQRDLYLKHPCRDFGETDEALRIRTVKDLDDGRVQTYLTYKGPKVSKRSKARFEREVRIPGADDFREILYRLSFEKVMVVEKERRTYVLGDMEACIDIIPGLGCFLELELKDSEVSRGEDRITRFLREWELTQVERRSYLELLSEK
jgi:adenylate cyclase class 2